MLCIQWAHSWFLSQMLAKRFVVTAIILIDFIGPLGPCWPVEDNQLNAGSCLDLTWLAPSRGLAPHQSSSPSGSTCFRWTKTVLAPNYISDPILSWGCFTGRAWAALMTDICFLLKLEYKFGQIYAPTNIFVKMCFFCKKYSSKDIHVKRYFLMVSRRGQRLMTGIGLGSAC